MNASNQVTATAFLGMTSSLFREKSDSQANKTLKRGIMCVLTEIRQQNDSEKTAREATINTR